TARAGAAGPRAAAPLQRVPPPHPLRHRLAPSGRRRRAPVPATSWLSSWISVVTDETVDPGLPLLVAVDAPTHVERLSQLDLRHRLHRSVALLALEPGVDVHHVREPDVVRQVVDPDPGDRDALLRVLDELLQLRAILQEQQGVAHRRVTAGARLHGRDPSGPGFVRAVVAVHAGDLQRTRVRVVRERDRLLLPAPASL